MTRQKQAVFWISAAIALVIVSLAVNAQVERKTVPLKCEGGFCTMAESDLVGLVNAAEHLLKENRALRASCGGHGT